MATRKDMRRPDLIIPYQTPASSESKASDITSTMATTLPMAAMFTRNRYIAWASFVFSVQGWLGESEESKSSASQPAILTVGMAILSMGVVYLPIFLPQPGASSSGTGTAPPAATAGAA